MSKNVHGSGGANRVPPIEAVIFDFDGTLADTREAVVNTFELTLDQFRVARPARIVITELMGLPLLETFRVVGVTETSLHDAVQFYRSHFFDNADCIALFAQVASALRAIAATGLPLAIASSRGRASLLTLLARLGIDELFCAVLGDEDAVRKKPAPDLVLALAQRMNIAPGNLLVVGDTDYDIEMGRAAGAYTCAVTHGCHDAERLRKAEPTWLVDSFEALQSLLGGMRTQAKQPR
jgi:phosphoglycolate phosphatase